MILINTDTRISTPNKSLAMCDVLNTYFPASANRSLSLASSNAFNDASRIQVPFMFPIVNNIDVDGCCVYLMYMRESGSLEFAFNLSASKLIIESGLFDPYDGDDTVKVRLAWRRHFIFGKALVVKVKLPTPRSSLTIMPYTEYDFKFDVTKIRNKTADLSRIGKGLYSFLSTKVNMSTTAYIQKAYKTLVLSLDTRNVAYDANVFFDSNECKPISKMYRNRRTMCLAITLYSFLCLLE